MLNRVQRAAWMALAVVAIALPARAQSLEEVEKKITEAGEKLKSFTADLSMESQMQQPGMSMESRAQGTIEFMREGEKLLLHMEQKGTMVTGTGDQKQRTEVSTLAVMDGEFMYVLTEHGGQKMAIKSKPEPGQMQLPGKSLFEQLRKDNELKLLPEEQIDGKDTYVIAATPKEKAGPFGKQMLYFAKDSGMLLKMVALDTNDKPMHTTTYSNLKLNVKIDPDRFKFKVPEGVELMDMTEADMPSEP